MSTIDTAVALHIDGRAPLTGALVAEVEEFGDRVEDAADRIALLRLIGTPAPGPVDGLSIHLVSKWERALRRLERLPVPTVAIAEGGLGGVAVEALLATDYRIGTGGFRLALPADREAAWPGMGLYRLANQVGVARIRRAVLFGGELSAEAASALGLVDVVVPDMDAALAAARRLAGMFVGTELAIRRQLLLEATTTSFEDALGTHLAACDRALRRQAVSG